MNIIFQPDHHPVTIVKSLYSSIKCLFLFELSTNDKLKIDPEPNMDRPGLN